MKMKIKKHGKVFYCSIKLINNFTLNGCNLYTQYQTFGKKEMVRDNGNCKNLLLPNHHLIKNNPLHDAEKLNAKELCSFSIFFENIKPISQKYFQDYFSGVQSVWGDIYSLPRIVMIDSELKHFQHKILHNVLHLNIKLFYLL